MGDNIDPFHRLEGGGCEPQEVYYDCLPCECEREPHLQVFEIINEIKNPKEFKSILKQVAHASNALYRTFRQAYGKTKTFHQNSFGKHSNICDNKCNKPCQQMECGDMNPLEIINVELPATNQEYMEDVYYESWNRKKHKKKKSSRPQKCCGEQHPSGFLCANCQNKENICNICLGALEQENNISDAKNFQKLFKINKTEQVSEIIKKQEVSVSGGKQECDSSTWLPKPSPCLVETNACQQYEYELQHLNFCERCAVLRGEMNLPSNKQNEALYNSKPNAAEKSSQTCQKIKCSKTEACSKSQKPLKSDKQVLNLNPVCVTIPLKLQIDSQNCQSRFIETEIVMEAFSGSQTCKLPQAAQTTFATFSSSITPTNVSTTATKSNKLKQQTGSDLFQSCMSSSGILKPRETPQNVKETALNKELDIVKKDSEETSMHLKETSTQSKSTQVMQPESSVATTMPAYKMFNSKTVLIQTEETVLPTLTTQGPKAKAKQFRAELLAEVKAALETTTPIDALKALLEGKRFSLPTDLRGKEIPKSTPVRHSFPSNHQAMPTSSAALQPLKPGGTTKVKPALPPKPTIPAKPASFATETVQTDFSTLPASVHHKRNELRTEIQDELKELLQPNRTSTLAKYAPEDRDEILLDLHKLFHPKKAGRLPKQISRENALQDISYLVGSEANKTEFSATAITIPKTSESQESIIQSIKHILDPKSQQKSKKTMKYDKETKEKILQDLQIILKPRPKKSDVDQEIRDSVLHDLRFMLQTGQESTSPQSLTQFQPVAAADTGPSSSRAQQVRQQRQEKPPNEIRDSVMADLKNLLDLTSPPQTNNNNSLADNLALTRQAKAAPSETSLSDNDKSSKNHK